jgi:hypothetical protein
MLEDWHVMPHVRLETPRGELFADWYGGLGHQVFETGRVGWFVENNELDIDLLMMYPAVENLPSEVVARFPSCTYQVPSWAELPAPGSTVKNLNTTICGWPLPALRMCQEDYVTAPAPGTTRWTVVRTPLHATRFPEYFGFRNTWLPLEPMPLGMLVNSVFYAGLVWGCVLGFRFLRIRARAHRGLCPGCAYDRSGLSASLPCPECGTPPRLPI